MSLVIFHEFFSLFALKMILMLFIQSMIVIKTRKMLFFVSFSTVVLCRLTPSLSPKLLAPCLVNLRQTNGLYSSLFDMLFFALRPVPAAALSLVPAFPDVIYVSGTCLVVMRPFQGVVCGGVRSCCVANVINWISDIVK